MLSFMARVVTKQIDVSNDTLVDIFPARTVN